MLSYYAETGKVLQNFLKKLHHSRIFIDIPQIKKNTGIKRIGILA